jgi:hypothetical protein
VVLGENLEWYAIEVIEKRSSRMKGLLREDRSRRVVP